MTSLEKRLGIALLVSLVVNAFLLGTITTHFARGHRPLPAQKRALRTPDVARPPGPLGAPGPAGFPRERRNQRGPVETKLLRDVVQALGGPRDPRVEGALRRGREQRLTHGRQMTEAQEAVRAALAAEPFDEERLRGRLAELRATAEAGQREAQEGLVVLARQLRPEERLRLRAEAHDSP